MTSSRAFAKYGFENCKKAYHLNRVEGEGANTIATQYDCGPAIKTTRQADAAINAYAAWLKTR